jgi:hypothetical protein
VTEALHNLMVRRRASAVSNHEAPAVGLILRDAALFAPFATASLSLGLLGRGRSSG